MNKKIIFYVQHLLGIGHLKRVSIIVNLISKKGLDITVISGGSKISSIDFGNATFVQLPPIKSENADFKNLLDEKGNKIDAALKKKRQELLLKIFNKIRPEILITEMFPFGRNQMKFEILPLLKQATKGKTVIISSIRDIIISDLKKEKIDQLNFILSKYYNYILVHGEESVYSIGQKLKLEKSNIKKIFYTGYVCEKQKKINVGFKNNKEILVSAGGGAVGKKIIINSIKASSLFPNMDFKWRIIIGINESNFNKKEYYKLAKELGGNIVFEKFSKNFHRHLQNCLISINQGGYNTLMEIISGRVKSIIIPFSEDIKSDQIIRAGHYSYLNYIKIIQENELSPSKLKNYIPQLIKIDPLKLSIPEFNGSENTYKFIADIIK
ncbi:MAG: hypothetical protein CMM49_03415 [Rhodospirillaceae bacterium]|nr:hypothetical protein [Rhodospirillaceae bacterium]|tara:strand:+ start:86772 stop:87917 length:1146 start_codon:yes stop_codon:yes gene_type:complete